MLKTNYDTGPGATHDKHPRNGRIVTSPCARLSRHATIVGGACASSWPKHVCLNTNTLHRP